MVIYYIFTIPLIFGFSALSFFYFSSKWSVIRKAEIEVSKKKRVIVICAAIMISIILFALYYVALYLIRRFIFIGNDAVNIDHEVYNMSLFIPLFILVFVACGMVALYLRSKGMIKSKDNDKIVRMIVKIFSVVIALSLLFSIMGNANYFKYDDNAIYYSSFFQFTETKANYSEVKSVYIDYTVDDSGGYSYTYKLRLKNGKVFVFGLYIDELKEINQWLVENGIEFNFEAPHCKTEYNRVFNGE